jgi:hypothetical protein
MILNATLKSDGKATSIPIPVGDGDHSFKWLALAASEHLTLRSSSTQRRSKHLAADLISKTHLRPRDVYTESTSFFHPEALLKDHLVDGDDITVELYSSSGPSLDEHHRPSLSKWSRISFGIGDTNADERDRLIEEKTAQLERERQRREEMELERRINWERPRLDCMTSILEEQLVGSQGMEQEQAARKEWALIIGSGKIDNVVKGEEERAKCCEILVQHYLSLCELYKDFSVVNTGGGIADGDSSQQTLEYMEFSKLLFDCKISLSSAVVQKIFLESSVRGRCGMNIMGNGGKAAAGIEVELCRYEFLLSLVKLSSYQFIALRRREQSMLRRKGHSKAISHATTPSPSEALQMLFDQNLRPVLEAMPVARVKHALASKEAMLLFFEHLETLTAIFSSYADVIGEDGVDGADANMSFDESRATGATTFTGTVLPPQGSLMTGTKFLSFARDASFLQSNESDGGDDRSGLGECSPLDVRKAFAASRKDVSGGDEGVNFPAFVEAVARLGIMAFCRQCSENPCSGEDKLIACIRRALEKCNSLQK